jgi:predicted Zn-dependent protease with MMP-like domain
MMVEVTEEHFEALVVAALESIPDELSAQMDNVAVVIEDLGYSANLLGLYEGVPLTGRGINYGGLVVPDRITIYRQPICRVARDEDDVVHQVTKTVIHEVGHHFGISDARLRELGWG